MVTRLATREPRRVLYLKHHLLVVDVLDDFRDRPQSQPLEKKLYGKNITRAHVHHGLKLCARSRIMHPCRSLRTGCALCWEDLAATFCCTDGRKATGCVRKILFALELVHFMQDPEVSVVCATHRSRIVTEHIPCCIGFRRKLQRRRWHFLIEDFFLFQGQAVVQMRMINGSVLELLGILHWLATLPR